MLSLSVPRNLRTDSAWAAQSAAEAEGYSEENQSEIELLAY